MTTTRIVRGLQSNVIRPAPQTTAVTCKQMTLPNTAQCRYLGLHYIALNEITEDGNRLISGISCAISGRFSSPSTGVKPTTGSKATR